MTDDWRDERSKDGRDIGKLLDGFTWMIKWLALRVKENHLLASITRDELFNAGYGERITQSGENTGALGALLSGYRGLQRDGPLSDYVLKETMREMLRAQRGIQEEIGRQDHVSLDDKEEEEGESLSLHERLGGYTQTSRQYASDEVVRLMTALDYREQSIIQMRFEDWTFAMIGQALGIGTSHAQRVYNKALDLLGASLALARS